MSSLKKFSLLTLITAIATSTTACSSGAIFGVTSWDTLSAGQAVRGHGSASEMRK